MSLLTFDGRLMQLVPSPATFWDLDLSLEEIPNPPTTTPPTAASIGTPFDSTSAALTYTTSSYIPVFGETVLILVTNRKGTAADIPTLTGTGGWNTTWTEIKTRAAGGSALTRATLFRGIPVSGTGGTLTATFSANQAQCSIAGVSFSGIDQTTDQGVVQSNTGAGGTGGNLAVTLADFSGSSNPVVLGGVARGTPTSFTPEGTYSEIEVVGGINGSALAWLLSPDTSPTGTLVSGTNWAAIAVELAALAATTVKPHLYYARMRG